MKKGIWTHGYVFIARQEKMPPEDDTPIYTPKGVSQYNMGK